MEDMLVTTSSKFLTLLIFFFLSTSCETINELTGLAKPELDDSLAIETPDLVLPNGIYVEIKGFLRAESRRKYENFKKQYPEIDLRFVFMNPNQRYQGSKRTNKQWAEKHGFIYADKRVPTSWFGEYKEKESN